MHEFDLFGSMGLNSPSLPDPEPCSFPSSTRCDLRSLHLTLLAYVRMHGLHMELFDVQKARADT